jgi:hypothetical protein
MVRVRWLSASAAGGCPPGHARRQGHARRLGGLGGPRCGGASVPGGEPGWRTRPAAVPDQAGRWSRLSACNEGRAAVCPGHVRLDVRAWRRNHRCWWRGSRLSSRRLGSHRSSARLGSRLSSRWPDTVRCRVPLQEIHRYSGQRGNRRWHALDRGPGQDPDLGPGPVSVPRPRRRRNRADPRNRQCRVAPGTHGDHGDHGGYEGPAGHAGHVGHVGHASHVGHG